MHLFIENSRSTFDSMKLGQYQPTQQMTNTRKSSANIYSKLNKAHLTLPRTILNPKWVTNLSKIIVEVFTNQMILYNMGYM